VPRFLRYLSISPTITPRPLPTPAAAGRCAVGAPDGDRDPTPLLPVAALGDIFDWKTAVAPTDADAEGGDATPGAGQVVVDPGTETALPPSSDPPQTPEALAARLGRLQSPLEGADPAFPAGHLPGAPRDYRHGIHEGFDWFGYAIAVPLAATTPVRAMAAGVVVRADHGWSTPTAAERQEWLDLAVQARRTPAWVLNLRRALGLEG